MSNFKEVLGPDAGKSRKMPEHGLSFGGIRDLFTAAAWNACKTKMKNDQEKLLNLRRLPVFLNVEQAADRLGLSVEEVRILVAAKLLPLAGNSERGEKQLFVTAKLERLWEDQTDWPDKARKALVSYHRRRNASRKATFVNGENGVLSNSRNGENHQKIDHAKNKNNRKKTVAVSDI